MFRSDSLCREHLKNFLLQLRSSILTLPRILMLSKITTLNHMKMHWRKTSNWRKREEPKVQKWFPLPNLPHFNPPLLLQATMSNLPPPSLEILPLHLHQEICSLLVLDVPENGLSKEQKIPTSRNQKHSGFTKSFITSRILFPILSIEIRKFSSTFFPNNQPNQSSQYHPTPASIQVLYDLPLLPITAMMSPYSTNISRLTTTILDNFGERTAYLQQLDPGGVLDLSKNGVRFAYYKSRDPTSSPNVTHSLV